MGPLALKSDNKTMSSLPLGPLFIAFLLILGSQTQARESHLIVKSYDLTKDGKLDRFETYDKGELKIIQEDRSGDGNVDFVKIFMSEENKEIEEQDLNHNGKFERRVTTRFLGEGKIERLVEVDRDEDGKFEIQATEIVNSVQKRDSCYEEFVFQQITDLAQNGLIASADLNGGLLPTGNGYLVDKACIQNWGPRFPDYLKESMTKGLQCLSDLQKKFGGPNQMTGALRNAYELSKLLEVDQVKIVCSEEVYDWDGTAGHASTSPKDKIESPKINHPFISLNPRDPKGGIKNVTQEDISEIKKTIFHEQLHNLGYRHGLDIEYPYTCEECCLSENEDFPGMKEAACKICAGNYQNDVDPNYVRDFILYTQKSFQNSRGLKTSVRYLKENPKSSLGISMVAMASADIFNPIGPKLGSLILEKNPSLSAEELANTMKAVAYKDSNHFIPLAKSSDSLAKAMYALYYEQDAKSALEIISANKEAISEELYDAVESSSDVNYSAQTATKVLDDMIYDIWINRFPKTVAGFEERSDQAYELQKYFEDKEILK